MINLSIYILYISIKKIFFNYSIVLQIGLQSLVHKEMILTHFELGLELLNFAPGLVYNHLCVDESLGGEVAVFRFYS